MRARGDRKASRARQVDQPDQPIVPARPTRSRSRSTGLLRPTKVDRGGRPSDPEAQFSMRFSTILVDFRVHFRDFFVRATRFAEQSLFRHDFATICFDFSYELRKTREGAKIALTSGLAAKNQGNCDVGSSSCQSTRSCDVTAKNDEGQREKRPEIIEKLLRKSFANELRQRNHDFSLPDATWHRFWLSRRAPRRSRALALGSWGALGRSRGAPETSQDAAKTSRNSSWNALGRHQPSGEGPGIDFVRFLMPRSFSRDGFWIDLALPHLTWLDVGCPG